MTHLFVMMSLFLLTLCIVSVWDKPVTPDLYAVFLMPLALLVFAGFNWLMNQVIGYRKGQPTNSAIKRYLDECDEERNKATEMRRNTPDGLG